MFDEYFKFNCIAIAFLNSFLHLVYFRMIRRNFSYRRHLAQIVSIFLLLFSKRFLLLLLLVERFFQENYFELDELFLLSIELLSVLNVYMQIWFHFTAF